MLATCFLFLRYFYVYNPIEKLSLKGYNYNVCIVQLKMTHRVFRFVIGGVKKANTICKGEEKICLEEEYWS